MGYTAHFLTHHFISRIGDSTPRGSPSENDIHRPFDPHSSIINIPQIFAHRRLLSSRQSDIKHVAAVWQRMSFSGKSETLKG